MSKSENKLENPEVVSLKAHSSVLEKRIAELGEKLVAAERRNGELEADASLVLKHAARIQELEQRLAAAEKERDALVLKVTVTETSVEILKEELEKRANRFTALETKLNEWQSLGLRASTALLEISEQRISQMVTESRMAEIMRENGSVIAALAQSIRDLLNKE